MGKFINDNESPDLFRYSTDVLEYATWEHQEKLEAWQDACETYRCGGYNGYRDYNPWRTVVGLEIEMEGGLFCIQDYSSLLNYGIFSEDSTVDAEYKGLPFRLSDWLRIIAENRYNFDEYLRNNAPDNGAGLHIHISQKCLSDEAAEYLRGFLCNCGDDVLGAIAGRELPNDHVYPYKTLDTGKYGYITRHRSNRTWEIRIFQSPDCWESLIESLVWVAILIQKAETTSDFPSEEGSMALDYGTLRSTWWEVYQEMLIEFEFLYPRIISNLKKLSMRQEEIDLTYFLDEEDLDYDESEDGVRYYDPVTLESFSNYEDYSEALCRIVGENPYSYMDDGYQSIKDLYTLGESDLFFESCFRELWISHEIFDTIRWMDDEIKDVLYDELWDYVKNIPWKKLVNPTAQDLFWASRREPLGDLTASIRSHGFNEGVIVEEFVERFLSLDFPKWYREKCADYHQENRFSNSYDRQKYPTEGVLYDYLQEEVRKLIQRAVHSNWVRNGNEYSNPILGVQLFTEYCELYPMLPLDLGAEYQLSNTTGIPLCWMAAG